MNYFIATLIIYIVTGVITSAEAAVPNSVKRGWLLDMNDGVMFCHQRPVEEDGRAGWYEMHCQHADKEWLRCWGQADTGNLICNEE